MTYDEFMEEQLAIHKGWASELMRCPIDDSLQGIAGVWRQPQSFPDPSEVVTLRCGHVVL